MSIDIINLSKTYQKINILNNINYKFYDNNKYLIKGENGIGKTTLFKSILKQIKYNGEIRVNGIISYAPEGGLMPPYMTIYSFVKLISNLTERINNFDNIFDKYYKSLLIDVKKDSLIGSLSKGQRQKINLLLTLITPSDILLFDEPLSGLDIESKKAFVKLIKKDKRMSIIISHETNLFRKNYFNILEIRKGDIYVLSQTD